MPVHSKMWGLNWESVKRARDFHQEAKETPPQPQIGLAKGPGDICLIPGRTARLKAVYLLQIAAEIEHSLMLQYLYAAYSIDSTFGQPEDPNLSRVINGWRIAIRGVARQEMAHFATVQNLLIALGDEPYCGRENNFLMHPDEYPFPMAFEKLSLDSLAKYVATESPDESGLTASERKSVAKITRQAGQVAKHKVNRVGMVYASLYWLFQKSDAISGPWSLPPEARSKIQKAKLDGIHLADSDFSSIAEYRRFAGTPDEWEVYESSTHVDETDPREHALGAIYWIMAQGEGFANLPSKDKSAESHFRTFLSIYDQFKENHRKSVRAVFRVPTNPSTRSAGTQIIESRRGDRITHPQSKLWAQLFNLRYQILITDLLLTLSMDRQHERELRSTVGMWAVGYEMRFLKTIGELLPRLPRHLKGKILRAGAPFEAVPIPAEAGKRWDVQNVLMAGTLKIIRRLTRTIKTDHPMVGLLNEIERFDAGRSQMVDRYSQHTRKYVWKDGIVEFGRGRTNAHKND